MKRGVSAHHKVRVATCTLMNTMTNRIPVQEPYSTQLHQCCPRCEEESLKPPATSPNSCFQRTRRWLQGRTCGRVWTQKEWGGSAEEKQRISFFRLTTVRGMKKEISDTFCWNLLLMLQLAAAIVYYALKLSMKPYAMKSCSVESFCECKCKQDVTLTSRRKLWLDWHTATPTRESTAARANQVTRLISISIVKHVYTDCVHALKSCCVGCQVW